MAVSHVAPTHRTCACCHMTSKLTGLAALLLGFALYLAAAPLATCPDCGRQVSARALMCPGCGCPGEAITASLDVTECSATNQLPAALGKRSNLRTQAHRIIRRAGLDAWERVFQNLRSSRETELVEDFPLKAVTDWIGNSPDVANKHYLQTHDEYFRRAAGLPAPVSGDARGTDGGRNGTASLSKEKQLSERKPPKALVNAEASGLVLVGAEACGTHMAPPRGVEPLLPG